MLSRIFCNQNHDCHWIRRHFSEYLDGALAAKERSEVHEHVRYCEECSDELDLLCKTLAVLVEFREEGLPEAVQRYRLPRSTFWEIFPTIRRESPPFTVGLLAPYLTALLLFLAALSTYDLWERHMFNLQYNSSN